MSNFFLRPDELEAFDPWQALLPSMQNNELCRIYAETWFSRQQQTKSMLETSTENPTVNSNSILQAEALMLEAALEWMQASSWRVEE